MGTMQYLALGAAVRCAMLCYSMWHDASLPVRYTDVDYDVFMDAACFVADGGSPYQRQTYRYPPLLAWLLVPGCQRGLWLLFGKILFCLCDVACAALLFHLCGSRPQWRTAINTLWLFNPVVINVSTRGNADSLVILPILLALAAHTHALASGRLQAYAAAGACLGAAVHLRLFPLIFLPSVGVAVLRALASGRAARAVLQGIAFGVPFACVVVGATYAGYALYGEEFLGSAYFYHYGRVDHRHNLSPYFLPAYLGGSVWGGFGPQLLAILAVSLRFAGEPAYCWFLCTCVFVSLNKVVTVQYFVWYLGLLPPALQCFSIPFRPACALVALWTCALLHWLYTAHALEFRGLAVFERLWVASLLFVAANCLCVGAAIMGHVSAEGKAKGD